MQQARMASHEHAFLCRDMSGNCCRTFMLKMMQASLSHSSWWSSTFRMQALPFMHLTSFLATGSGYSLSSQIITAIMAAVQRIFWSLRSSRSHPRARSARRARVRRPRERLCLMAVGAPQCERAYKLLTCWLHTYHECYAVNRAGCEMHEPFCIRHSLIPCNVYRLYIGENS